MGSREAPADGSAAKRQPDQTAMTAGRHGLGAHLCFVTCCAITVYAAINRGPLVLPVVPAQPAVPFFGPDSAVVDFFTGDLAAALRRVGRRHAALVFLYAPWDRACQAGRATLETLSALLHGQVEVLAVNCWHAAGSCRREVRKIASFPVVIVYLRQGRGLHYSGPLDVGRLARFVEGVLRPLRRLETAADLVRLRATHTAVAIGYTPFQSGRPPAAYFSLLRASLLSLQAEPDTQVAWAVVTSASAAGELGLVHPGGLSVVNWNITMVLKPPVAYALSAELMQRYVVARRRETAGWLQLADSKSAALRSAVSAGPVLLVLDPAADSARPVRRVWLEYNNCNRSEAVTRLGLLTDIALSEAEQARSRLRSWCSRTERAEHQPHGHCTGQDASCPPGPDTHPDKWLEEMGRQQTLSRCSLLALSTVVTPDVPDAGRPLVNITGLRCATNRTLAMHLMDSRRHAALARRLGLPTDRAAAVIIDTQAESQYVLATAVSAHALSQFVADYTAGSLSRRLVSRAAPAAGDVTSGAAGRLVGAVEMTSSTFGQVALNVSEDVIVFFYSKGCGYCSISNHVFLAAMRLFMNTGLRFARIDGADNDLRWEFTMDSFPTMMYLPARRKADSRVFPAELPVTLAHLLRFILANASRSVRHAFFLGRCRAACRATTAWAAGRQAALVRRLQLCTPPRPRAPLLRQAAELARLRRLLRAAPVS